MIDTVDRYIFLLWRRREDIRKGTIEVGAVSCVYQISAVMWYKCNAQGRK